MNKSIYLLVCTLHLAIGTALLSSTSARATEAEETFVFAGRCPNGEPYRLFSYQKNIDGLLESHYDYEGPVGKGTVQSETQPRVMAVRVCRQLAEIISTNYWK